MSKGVDVDELELAGLSEAELQELSEFIDPDVSHFTIPYNYMPLSQKLGLRNEVASGPGLGELIWLQ